MSDDKLPRGSCDCHVHVFGDAKLFPPTANAAYPPPPASRAQLEQIHATLGIARAVLVQPTIYGTDHRALLDALRDRLQYRGVAIVNDQVTDEELMTLHRAGIRAARFSLGGPLGGMSLPELDRSIGRIRELGWHAKLGGTARDFIANALWLRGLNCTAVLDHLAGTTPTDGLAAQMVDLSKDLLQTGNWWVLLANADRRSQTTDNWDDMVSLCAGFGLGGAEACHLGYRLAARALWQSRDP